LSSQRSLGGGRFGTDALAEAVGALALELAVTLALGAPISSALPCVPPSWVPLSWAPLSEHAANSASRAVSAPRLFIED
jgi:hypothetical protein